MRQAHAKATRALSVGETNLTFHPGGGQALRCRTRTDLGDAGGAAEHRTLHQLLTGSSIPVRAAAAVRSQRAPAQTHSPGNAAAPSPRRRARSRLSPFHALPTCKAPLRLSLVPARRRVPAGTGAEPLWPLRAAAPGQQTWRDGRWDISPATQTSSPRYLDPHFCPRLRSGESRGGRFFSTRVLTPLGTMMRR